MTSTNPCDFLPLKAWFYEYGKEVFGSDKMLHYHTKPIQKELIEAGGMAKIGVHIYLHKTRFWPEYQRPRHVAEAGYATAIIRCCLCAPPTLLSPKTLPVLGSWIKAAPRAA